MDFRTLFVLGTTSKRIHSLVESRVRLLRLHSFLFDLSMIKSSLAEMGYDCTKLPIAKVTPAYVDRSIKVLQRLEHVLPRREQIDQSLMFYTLVPHDFWKPPAIEGEVFHEEILLLKVLDFVAEFQTQLLEGDERRWIDPNDWAKGEELILSDKTYRGRWEALKGKFAPVKMGSEEWQMVMNMVAPLSISVFWGRYVLDVFRVRKSVGTNSADSKLRWFIAKPAVIAAILVKGFFEQTLTEENFSRRQRDIYYKGIGLGLLCDVSENSTATEKSRLKVHIQYLVVLKQRPEWK
eukprot:TRINITY_DN12839_c0_g1_i1.p1 TRINITY_DN12839_c0_g1~~TRINITY_DN12839_c0_g1_i1.p1  ORF type:complete len:324 (+),score=27.76 TRINITY_DN12839_c0_g1_i1:95-973(+)